MRKNIHLGRSLQQCCSKQDKNCMIIYTVFGCILGIFLLWLITLSVMKSLRGEQGERGPPGPIGPEGAVGPAGVTSDTEMKNAKIFSITKDTDFSTSTEVKARSGFLLDKDASSDVTITLPHYSVIGNGAVFHIYNQSPVYTLSVKAAKIDGQKPAQMSFTSGGTSIKMLPRQFLTIVIMAQQYVLFTEEEKNNKPIPDLTNSKGPLNIESKGPNPNQGTLGGINIGFGNKNLQKSGLTDKEAQCYLNRYSDLRNAFGANNIKAAKKHWLSNGIHEKRTYECPNQGTLGGINIGFGNKNLQKSGLTDKEAQCYLNRYSDLRNAFGANNIKAAKKHWLSNGIHEKRTYECPKKVPMLGLVKNKR